ncbi:hypothetical protein [Klebsiella oxytoca]|uniref:hypothetical protein n=1 Tax=Klebsiella oxytoca TaxID=571 RepID=UPI00163BCB84|nr:hypothetical protein [Klebsiella oxytoca]
MATVATADATGAILASTSTPRQSAPASHPARPLLKGSVPALAAESCIIPGARLSAIEPPADSAAFAAFTIYQKSDLRRNEEGLLPKSQKNGTLLR